MYTGYLVVLSSIALLEIGIYSDAKEVKFDYYVYAQQWPESVCQQTWHMGQHNCSIGKNTTAWTVHGLWPSLYSNATLPANCDPSAKFNFSALESILSELEAKWPNLYTDEKLTSFWSHEWYKHGTCALAAKAVKNEKEYFQKALDLNSKLDILGNLIKRKVPPLDKYSYLYTDFLSAVMDIVGGKKVYLECDHRKHQTGTNVLQLQICLDKKFQPIDCKHEHNSNCKGWPIDYPPIHHPY